MEVAYSLKLLAYRDFVLLVVSGEVQSTLCEVCLPLATRHIKSPSMLMAAPRDRAQGRKATASPRPT